MVTTPEQLEDDIKALYASIQQKLELQRRTIRATLALCLLRGGMPETAALLTEADSGIEQAQRELADAGRSMIEELREQRAKEQSERADAADAIRDQAFDPEWKPLSVRELERLEQISSERPLTDEQMERLAQLKRLVAARQSGRLELTEDEANKLAELPEEEREQLRRDVGGHLERNEGWEPGT